MRLLATDFQREVQVISRWQQLWVGHNDEDLICKMISLNHLAMEKREEFWVEEFRAVA